MLLAILFNIEYKKTNKNKRSKWTKFLLSIYLKKIHLLGPLFSLIYCVKVLHISCLFTLYIWCYFDIILNVTFHFSIFFPKGFSACVHEWNVLLFSRSVTSASLRLHGLHAKLPCPPPSPGACSNSCLLSWWCHPTISSSIVPFSFCLQSLLSIQVFSSESGLFQWVGFSSDHFASDGQSIRASASASVPPVNIQDWFPLGLTGWIPLQPKGLSRGVLSNTTV